MANLIIPDARFEAPELFQPQKKPVSPVELSAEAKDIFGFFHLFKPIDDAQRNPLRQMSLGYHSETWSGASPKIGIDEGGYYALLDATVGIAIAPTSSGGASAISCNDYIFVTRFKLVSRDGDGRNVLFDRRAPSQQLNPVLHCENSIITDGIRFYDGTNAWNSPNGVMPLNQYKTIVARGKGTTFNAWIDGVRVINATGVSGSMSSNNNFAPLHHRYGFTTSVDDNSGRVQFCGFGEATPSDGWCQDFSANPYKYLMPV